MTKEELEKENKRLTELLNHSNVRLAEEQLQNVELEEENEQLKQQIEKEKKFSKDVMNNELRLIKLIEKMKSCGNCKWCSNQCCIENFENPISYRGCENYSKWELAE